MKQKSPLRKAFSNRLGKGIDISIILGGDKKDDHKGSDLAPDVKDKGEDPNDGSVDSEAGVNDDAGFMKAENSKDGDPSANKDALMVMLGDDSQEPRENSLEAKVKKQVKAKLKG